MYVAIDTNALPFGWQVQSAEGRALIKFLEQTGSKLLLSEAVRIEIMAKFKRECMEALNNLDSAFRRVKKFGIDIPKPDKRDLAAQALSHQRQAIAEELSETILQPVPIRRDSTEEIVQRLAERRRPASSNGEEFRDCVIWSDLLDYAQNNPTHRPIALITNDNGFSEDKTSLHPQLQQELNDRSLDISYYASIKDFLRAQNAEIPDEDILAGGEVTLTNGWLKVQSLFAGPRFRFIGPEFDISNNHADQGNVAAWRCSPCRAKEPLSLNSTFAGELGLGSGRAVIKGKEYARLYYTGAIDFYGDAEVPKSESPQVYVTGEYRFQGFMKGYERNPFASDPGEAAFDVKLNGRGMATVELASYITPQHGRLYDFRNITYEFRSEKL